MRIRDDVAQVIEGVVEVVHASALARVDAQARQFGGARFFQRFGFDAVVVARFGGQGAGIGRGRGGGGGVGGVGVDG